MTGLAPDISFDPSQLERSDFRAPMRETPAEARQRAADRVAQLRGLYGDNVIDEGTDEFHIDRSIIPEGWDYEWKRHTLVNKEDPAYQVSLARTGWTPVPAARHPEMMPHDSRDAFISRKGMVLYERPMEITEEVRRLEKKKARDQVRIKEEQLNDAPGPGQFERNNKGQPMTSVKKTHVPMPVPE